MFTGLVEEVGTILQVERGETGGRYTVQASTVLQDAGIGDSIAVDGACMTVVALNAEPGAPGFTFEASPESLSKTNLSGFEPGRRVNLERPLTPTSRIGGHYVTGHVDGLATVASITPQGNSIIYTFKVDDPALAELLIPKGSVAILGISLTVNTVDNDRFSVAIIPHTLAHTNLGDYQPGDRVNIETDLLGKYVRRLLFSRAPGDNGLPPAAGMLENGAAIDDAALAPAMNTFVPVTGKPPSAQPLPSTIRSGGWFNFEQ